MNKIISLIITAILLITTGCSNMERIQFSDYLADGKIQYFLGKEGVISIHFAFIKVENDQASVKVFRTFKNCKVLHTYSLNKKNVNLRNNRQLSYYIGEREILYFHEGSYYLNYIDETGITTFKLEKIDKNDYDDGLHRRNNCLQ